jgi:hypothetical protein
MQEFYSKDDRIEVRLANLLNIEEQRDASLYQFSKHQVVVKRWFDKRAGIKDFRIYDLVLLWDKARERKGDHHKFERLWLGPYQIAEILDENIFRLSSLTGEPVPLPVNGQFLKHYFGS